MPFEHFPPTIGKGEYHCPYCSVYAKQFYAHLKTLTNFGWNSAVDSQSTFDDVMSEDWIVTKCQRCSQVAFWHGKKMVFPKETVVAPPNKDLSESIKADYIEAASVLADSPRAAAALIRLALQKLCVQLGEDGKNINDDIKSLVKKGLNPLVQKALDTLRINGNNAVHPGEIDLSEDSERVLKLFELINFIASKMITEPREIEAFYDGLPSGAIQAIDKRDNA